MNEKMQTKSSHLGAFLYVYELLRMNKYNNYVEKNKYYKYNNFIIIFRRDNMKIKLIKSISIIIVCLIVIFLVCIGRKMLIINDLNNKLMENLNVENCCVEMEFSSGDIHVNSKTYVKDDDSFVELVRTSKDGTKLILTEINKSGVAKTYVETSEEKYFMECESPLYIPIGMYNKNNSKSGYCEGFGEIFKTAILAKISKVEINGHKCYEIKSDFYGIKGENNAIKTVLYIDKESGLCIRYVEEWEDNGTKTTTTSDYTYTFDEVKDEDIDFLNESEYVDKTNEQKKLEDENESLYDVVSENEVEVEEKIEVQIETKKDL